MRSREAITAAIVDTSPFSALYARTADNKEGLFALTKTRGGSDEGVVEVFHREVPVKKINRVAGVVYQGLSLASDAVALPIAAVLVLNGHGLQAGAIAAAGVVFKGLVYGIVRFAERGE